MRVTQIRKQRPLVGGAELADGKALSGQDYRDLAAVGRAVIMGVNASARRRERMRLRIRSLLHQYYRARTGKHRPRWRTAWESATRADQTRHGRTPRFARSYNRPPGPLRVTIDTVALSLSALVPSTCARIKLGRCRYTSGAAGIRSPTGERGTIPSTRMGHAAGTCIPRWRGARTSGTAAIWKGAIDGCAGSPRT